MTTPSNINPSEKFQPLSIKDWDKFQHYKHRNPPWIRLYTDLLDDPEFYSLDPVAAKTLMLLWLLASKNQGKLPASKKLAFCLRMAESEVSSVLPKLSHWITIDDSAMLAPSLHDAIPETETETETETERKLVAAKPLPKTKRGSRLPEEWMPSQEGLNFAESKLGNPRTTLELDKFRDHWKSKGVARVDWEATWRNWVRNCRGVPPPATPAPNGLVASTKIFVPAETAPYQAWEAHLKAKGQKCPKRERHGPEGTQVGWWFDSEWPPGDQGKVAYALQQVRGLHLEGGSNGRTD